jgi:hypothetical protein
VRLGVAACLVVVGGERWGGATSALSATAQSKKIPE